MSDKTPKKAVQLNNSYSPIILPESPAISSPQKNLTGLPRVAKDLIADIYNNIQKWNDLHLQGAKITKEIGQTASTSQRYTVALDKLTSSLYDLVEKLSERQNLMDSYRSQFQALADLDKNQNPLFLTRSLSSLAGLVDAIVAAYRNELQSKRFVLENIAHSRNADELMFHVACWVYQISIDSDINMKMEVLLLESGHRKIS